MADGELTITTTTTSNTTSNTCSKPYDEGQPLVCLVQPVVPTIPPVQPEQVPFFKLIALQTIISR